MTTIYIGYSNKKYGLSQFTIYKERPHELIGRLMGEYPLVGRLFVNVTDFADAEKDLAKPESIIAKAAKAMIGNG